MIRFSLLFILLAIGYQASCQTNIKLNIHHKLGQQSFSYTTLANDNTNGDFQFADIRYYLSEITLIHDGGQELIIPESWQLVIADEMPLEIPLGDFNINIVEGIKMHFGVDSIHNHADPSMYPNNHPLALQTPSMHWSWATGYRFARITGYFGDSLNTILDFHPTGNSNYYPITLPITPQSGNALTINIDANYQHIFTNILLSESSNMHGEDRECKTIAQNFRDHIFSVHNVISSTENINNSNIQLYPNPSSGLSYLWLDENTTTTSVSIYNSLGQCVQILPSTMLQTAPIELNFDEQGIYFIQIEQENTIISKKLIIH